MQYSPTAGAADGSNSFNVAQAETFPVSAAFLSDSTRLIHQHLGSLYLQTRPCNHGRQWSAGSTTPCPTMVAPWTGGPRRRWRCSMLAWTRPASIRTPRGRTSGWMGSFAGPRARTASATASRSATGPSTSTRRSVAAAALLIFSSVSIW